MVNPRERRAIVTLAVISLIVLAVAASAWRFVSPAVAPRINVRWSPGVSDDARLAVERELAIKQHFAHLIDRASQAEQISEQDLSSLLGSQD